MIIAILIITGLAFGSFVNALTWRIFMQDKRNKTKTKISDKQVNLAISTGRSVCVHCGHELAPKDLVPVISWLSLGGKCRYCRKPIEDSPVAELATAALFVISYLAWPWELFGVASWLSLVMWLAIVVGLVALAVYDFRYMILPNRIVFPLMFVALAMRVFIAVALETPADEAIRDIFFGVLVGGGFFYVLFQVSGGRWIGGGDVKLGYLIGITLGSVKALIALLGAFYIAAFLILPLMLAGRVNRKSKIPFGPFLIAGFILSMLWSDVLRDTYNSLFGL